jgi:hypothetical protein
MATENGLISFSADSTGWRAAIGQPETKEIILVPIIGWAVLAEGEPRSVDGGDLEPVVLFDNAPGPVISPLGQTLHDWDDGSFLHQILGPGASLRNWPPGWATRAYAG